jgi:putative endonuclease
VLSFHAMKTMHVYIMSNVSKTLYVGVTSNLLERVRQHKSKSIPGFTARYNITKLVYYEEGPKPLEAIAREKELKGWLRRKKIDLIESQNPEWLDLSEDW